MTNRTYSSTAITSEGPTEEEQNRRIWAERDKRVADALREAEQRRKREDEEATQRSRERQQARLATITPLSSLSTVEQAAARAQFDAAVKAHSWDRALAQLTLLPHTAKRGDGAICVAYQRFAGGKVVTAALLLDEAGILLDPNQSPMLKIAEDRARWEAEQAEARTEKERRQAAHDRAQVLRDRRARELQRLLALQSAARAALLTAHELRDTQPALARAFERMAALLAISDRDAYPMLVVLAEATITEDEAE